MTNDKKVIIICAVTNNGAIGINDELLVKSSEEMNHFKETTTNNTVIYGYNTFKSLGYKPLKNRNNYVVTSKLIDNQGVTSINIHNVHNLINSRSFKNNLYICGGEKLYNYIIDNQLYDEAIISVYDFDMDGDAYLNTKKLIEQCETIDAERRENFTIYYLKKFKQNDKKYIKLG